MASPSSEPELAAGATRVLPGLIVLIQFPKDFCLPINLLEAEDSWSLQCFSVDILCETHFKPVKFLYLRVLRGVPILGCFYL